MVIAAAGAIVPAAPAAEVPKRFAVLVGVQAYEHADLRTPPLKYPVSDVTELDRVLRPAGYETQLLTDDTGKT